jgi:hypothetical protein
MAWWIAKLENQDRTIDGRHKFRNYVEDIARRCSSSKTVRPDFEFDGKVLDIASFSYRKKAKVEFQAMLQAMVKHHMLENAVSVTHEKRDR